MKRTLWYDPVVDRPEENSSHPTSPEPHADRVQVESQSEANLIGSLIAEDKWYGGPPRHAPALDIDLPCQLFRSKSPGKFHLYINKPMSWEAYEKLLLALGEAGILEPGYVSACIARKQSFLRLPVVTA